MIETKTRNTEENAIRKWWRESFLGLETKLVQKRFRWLFYSSLPAIIIIPLAFCFADTPFFAETYTDKFWRFMAPVLSALIFAPIAYRLWTYRTVDREKQDNFDHYAQGIQLVTSSGGLQRVAGVNLLTQVSEQTQEYNEQIKDAFIETLKSPIPTSEVKGGLPPKTDRENIFESLSRQKLEKGRSNSYVQSILRWLYQRIKNGMRLELNSATLSIYNQLLNLTDEDCLDGLILLLLQEDVEIWFTNVMVTLDTNYTIYLHADKAHQPGRPHTLVMSPYSLVEFIARWVKFNPPPPLSPHTPESIIEQLEERIAKIEEELLDAH